MRCQALFAFALLSLALGGCAADESEDDAADESSDAITGGTETTERANTLGHLSIAYTNPSGSYTSSFCTATVVAANVVVTAAKCLEIEGQRWTTASARGWRGDFLLSPRAEGSFDRTSFAEIADVRVVDGQPGIALLKLDHALTKARPASLAAAAPRKGAQLSIYGYGCSQDGKADGMVTRKASFSWGTFWGTSLGCDRSGDIGAAVFDGSGKLTAVLGARANNMVFGTDVFVTIPSSSDAGRQISAAVAAWR
jgi:hypothetical protein